MARQGYANAQFEVNAEAEEGVEIVDEFYADEVVESMQVQPESKAKAKPKFNQGEGFIQDIQQGLQGSVREVN